MTMHSAFQSIEQVVEHAVVEVSQIDHARRHVEHAHGNMTLDDVATDTILYALREHKAATVREMHRTVRRLTADVFKEMTQGER